MVRQPAQRGPVREPLSPERFAESLQPFEKSSTLPVEAFTSPEIYQLELEKLLSREWLCAGRVDQVAQVGDYFTLDLLGDRLVIVRGKDDVVRVLSRICRHRAAEVVKGAGNTKSFSCPYHAWTYHLDGRLGGAPLMEEAEGFDRAACRLPEIPSEVWEGWIFVNFDEDAEALAPRLAPLSKLLANYKMSEMVAVETATFDSAFNWKVLVDNFMEAYHHIATHRDTLEPVFPAALSHTPDNEGPYSVLVMPEGENDPASAEAPEPGLPPHGDLTSEESRRLVAAVVFPFHLFAPSNGALTWYQILPESVDRFTLRVFTCFPETTLGDPAHATAVEGLQAITQIIHNQDIEACEAVQAGLESRSFERGPLAPLEKSIWQFNRWWIERMVGS